MGLSFSQQGSTPSGGIFGGLNWGQNSPNKPSNVSQNILGSNVTKNGIFGGLIKPSNTVYFDGKNPTSLSPKQATAGAGGHEIYGQYGGTGTMDYAYPQNGAHKEPGNSSNGPVKSITTTYHPPSTGGSGLNASGSGGTSNTDSSSGMTGTENQGTGTQQGLIQISQPGTPAYYANKQQEIINQEQALTNQYAPLIASSGTQPGTGKGFAQDLTNFNSAGYNAKLSGLNQEGTQNQALLESSLPGQQGLTSTLYNPLQGAEQGGQGLGNRASIAGNVGNLQDLQGKYNNIQVTVQGIQGLKTQLGSLIGTGVNPSDVNAVNSAIQGIASNVSNPNYAALNNLVTELGQRYASYLGSGGTVTNDVRDAAAGLIPGKASGQTIMTVLNGLDQQSNAVLSGYGNQIQYLQNQLNSGQGFSQQGGGSNGSGIYNF